MRKTVVLIAALLIAPQSQADSLAARRASERGDFATAFREWSLIAGSGDAEGLLNVGLFYDTGQGVAQNFAAALEYYQRAAMAGNATAMFDVGVMYDAGRGVPVDRQEAARWYETAARMGFGRAEYNLAMMYEHGDGVRRDLPRAKALYAAAYRHGVQAAASKLAISGDQQDGTKVGEFGRAEALILAHGGAQVGKQVIGALIAASEHGDALAQYDLGYCYENGIGVSADRVKAFLWYSRAAQVLSNKWVHQIAESSASALHSQMTPEERRAAAPTSRQEHR